MLDLAKTLNNDADMIIFLLNSHETVFFLLFVFECVMFTPDIADRAKYSYCQSALRNVELMAFFSVDFKAAALQPLLVAFLWARVG